MSVYCFPINIEIFWEKDNKVCALRRFCFVFPIKLSTFWHIPAISFHRKCIKFIDILIFMTENRTAFNLFLFNYPIFEKTESKWAFKSIFGWKWWKSGTRENLLFETRVLFKTFTDRKMKNILDVILFQ